MATKEPSVRALGLCSGGLDSMLAGLVLREIGIDVRWVTFETPFFSAQKAKNASQRTGIPLTVKNITPVYLEMLHNPPCGYGQQMNPCLDCHALMFRIAGKIMAKNGDDFLFSGEVLGQRPMSQTRPSLRYVEKHSGFEGYILRPLSARLLAETIPERAGKVDREKLLAFSGRSRKPQIKLARSFGITNYPTPAGGCLLTDVGFSRRLKDLFEHPGEVEERDYHLLKHGRHFRLNPETKIIVGRTQTDNENIVKYYCPKTDALIQVQQFPGPTVLMPGGSQQDAILLASSVCAGYSKAPSDRSVKVDITYPSGQKTVEVIGLPPGDFSHLLV
ncbi:MAG: tRNA 4-thiouridine(8) synthase ThiI [Deltaproteobacteria bacterium]|nr:tRNA 4-thiouridine(8) synthase ThiI [Deltaproteobacteria bacterium]